MKAKPLSRTNIDTPQLVTPPRSSQVPAHMRPASCDSQAALYQVIQSKEQQEEET